LKFREFEDEARGLVSSALTSLGMPAAEADVAPPTNPSYGDLSSAVALRLGKTLAEKPSAIALKIADRIMSQSHTYRYVRSVEAHPGGYLNFRLNLPRFALDSITEINSGVGLASSNLGSGKRMAIEHTNVNPNKALHVGHARNLVLGDSLVRIMRDLGYNVQALNYIDDSGAQVADIVVGFKFLGLSDTPPPGTKFDSYCGDNVYVRVNQEYAKDPTLREKQSFVLREIEKGKGEIADYTKRTVARILDGQLVTCWRLGASYDLLNWESQIVHSGIWNEIFGMMKENGLAVLQTQGDNAGCWITHDPDTGQEKVLVRSDGTAVYVAKDIPYAAWKIGLTGDPFGYRIFRENQPTDGPLWTTVLDGGGEQHPQFGHADIAVSVIDATQAYLQRIVGKVLDGLKEGSAKKYIHRGYEVVALSKKTASSLGLQLDSEFVHMSGRKGLYVNVDSVLQLLKEKAVEETLRRNPSENEVWLQDVSEAVAVAALRYELLRQDSDKMIVFDVEASLRFEGDTGPYLLYTYARSRRILEKSTQKAHHVLTIEGASKLTKPQERDLVKKVSMLDKAVMTAGEYLSPKEVAVYAHDLAVTFNAFYERVPVNIEQDEELRMARLALVEACGRVLSKSMTLLGLPYKERI
jgi:arginyl-tRNA synthetase